MGIVYIASKLLKTVGFLAVRLDLDKIRIKNQIKRSIFDQNLNSMLFM